MIKKRYLFLILIVCLFAISAVSGAEMGNDTNMVVNDYDSSLITESVNEDILSVSLSNDEIVGSADGGTFTDLQKKIDDADDGEIIYLENDYVYNNNSDIDIFDGIAIRKTIIIEGNGFKIDGNNQSRLFYIGGEDSLINISFNNISFLNGHPSNLYGGAIYGYNVNLKINNSCFNNNSIRVSGSSSAYGGAIYLSYGNLSLYNSVFNNNTIFNYEYIHKSIHYGGAISINNGNLIVSSSRFINNTLDWSRANSNGGSIYIQSTKCHIINSIFINNIADENGGAIYCDGENTTIFNSTFINNSASNGGAIYLNNGFGNVTNCILEDNFATYFGAAIYWKGNDGNIFNSTVKKSKTSGGHLRSSGAIYWDGENGILDNIIFIDNIANHGSAFYCDWGANNISIINSYFSNNSADFDGGAIYWAGSNGNVYNSIFDNNRVTSDGYTNCGGAINWDGINGLLNNNTFVNNIAKFGGAIKLNSNCMLNNSKFMNNYAFFNVNNGGFGGAIYCNENTTIFNSTFINNSASNGGAIYLNNGFGNVTNCILENNFAPCGSAIHWISKNGLIDSSIIINHNGSSTGTVHISSENITISNSILVNTDLLDIFSTSSTTFANNNWYGNVLDNKTTTPNVLYDVNLDKWHYLDAFTDTSTLKIGESAIISIDLNQLTNNEGKIGYNNELPDICVNVTSLNGICNVSTVKLKDGKAKITFTPENAGYGSVTVNYLTVSQTINFLIKDNRIEPNMTFNVEDKHVGETIEIEAFLPSDATGNVTFCICNNTYSINVINGEAKLSINDLPENIYEFIIDYGGDDKYSFDKVTGNVTVKPYNVILNAPDLIKYYGSTDKLYAQLLDKSNKPLFGQKIIFTVNGKDYERITDNAGTASMNINLISGNHTANVRFEGNGTYDAIKTTVKIQIKSTIYANDFSKIYRNGTQYYGTFVDSQGNLIRNMDVKININGVFYTRTTYANGVAKMNINLPPGTYILTATNPLSGEQHTTNVTVLPSIVENYDLTKYYKNSSKYTLRIIGDDGKPVGEGVTVKLNINGVFYERKTNATGYMNMNINLPPGTYTVTAEYNGLRASNKITVLSVLETRDLVMKYKDGSKFEAKVLDGQGKPYGGQTVTFNINGVFYTKTTEADGIARLKINLLAGEYIITSMYNGLNAANKVIINNLKSPEEQYKDLLGPNGANGYVYYPDGTYEHFVNDIVVDGTHYVDKSY